METLKNKIKKYHKVIKYVIWINILITHTSTSSLIFIVGLMFFKVIKQSIIVKIIFIYWFISANIWINLGTGLSYFKCTPNKYYWINNHTI